MVTAKDLPEPTSDPNAIGQRSPDHALIGGVVAVVVFILLCLIIALGRYLARHKGTYLTHEAKGSEDALDADTAIINAEGNHVHDEEKKEYYQEEARNVLHLMPETLGYSNNYALREEYVKCINVKHM
ncbi:hypothetical protein DPEC_G00296490 [Dallia pectoralis]|uniref:Uncharacterized protein n=1 Tax=Dallia pectoralis TaxID=75939 RepID=A0ACC2FFB2_DALPE|nr:hypothetical protein DPEC_G00296490 [Dallia pectoralis]